MRSFEPDADWQAEQVARIYAETGRNITYLGDWHTHPFGNVNPSAQDAETAAMIGRDRRFRTPIPLYAVAARDRWRVRRRSKWTVAVYEWRDDEFVQLEVIDWAGNS